MSKQGNNELVKERDVFFQKILEQPMDDVVGLLERIANLETFGCFTIKCEDGIWYVGLGPVEDIDDMSTGATLKQAARVEIEELRQWRGAWHRSLQRTQQADAMDNLS